MISSSFQDSQKFSIIGGKEHNIHDEFRTYLLYKNIFNNLYFNKRKQLKIINIKINVKHTRKK